MAKANPVHFKRISLTHVRCIIETRQHYYAADWAAGPGDEPTEEKVREAWREDCGRKDFIPYDWSTGSYC